MKGVRVRPAGLRVGDFLVADPSVYVVEVYADVDGVWVEYSDGDCGYQVSPVRVLREE